MTVQVPGRTEPPSSPPPATALTGPGGSCRGWATVLVVVAHPDDEFFGLGDASVRERAVAVADKIEDLRVELTRSLRHARPAAAPAMPAARPPAKPAAERSAKALDDMTVQELRRLATKRHVAGRSSMNKAELVEALGKT